MALNEPLRFQPVFRRYLWGGRRLESVLGKALPAGDDYAESWEVVDHRETQSVVLAGEFAGWTLSRLVQQQGAELLGRHHPQPQFPLLFKFLDAHRNLSVQVHPNDEQAARLDPPDRGKTEAWVVLYAEPGSRIYAGFKAGVDRAQVIAHLQVGTLPEVLHHFEPAVGDALLIPAGTVHALGEGLVVAEIQQASDTTFRLFDWNRVGPDGKPRPLHIEQALEVIDFARGPLMPVHVNDTTEAAAPQRLVTCDKFVLERYTVAGPFSLPDDRRCHLIAVIEGQLGLQRDPVDEPLGRGQTALIPAAARPCKLIPQSDTATLLDIFLPS